MVQNKLMLVVCLFPTLLVAQTRFIPSTYVAGDQVGNNLFAAENEIFIGAYRQKVGTQNQQGALYVFDITNNTGKQKLTASDGATLDQFGTYMSMQNKWLAIAATGDNNTNTDAGSVYMFYKDNNGTYTEKKKITSPDDIGYALFGFNIELKDNIMAVGARVTLGGFGSRGAVYVFGKDEGGADNWGLITTLGPSDAAANLYFGSSGSVTTGSRSISFGDNNEILFIGASGRSSNRGAVYVFKNISGTWTETQILTASDNAVGDVFGQTVRYFGGRLFVAAPSKSTSAGKVYIFEDNGSGTWVQTETIVPNDPASSDKFGTAIKPVLNKVYISAPASETEGAVYVFSKDVCNTNTWTQIAKNVIDAPAQQYGNAIDVWGDIILIGASTSDYDSKTDVGAAFKL
jgi:hypothetical protein